VIPSSYDQRSERIRFTPHGHAAIEAIRELVQGVENEWEEQLGPRKFAQLRDLLTQLYAIASRIAEGASVPRWP
jgi:DNA-binding MarR family transcriptional regulator